jgi:mannose-6-phosphate isomerase-like protein (cupin superfamily)
VSTSRGHLRPAADAPEHGELTEQLAAGGGFVVELILSGEVETPLAFLEERDEWVVVLEGAAVLEAEGEKLVLGGGDWVLLPAGTPHRLLQVAPGTRWLAVHGRA